MEFRPCIDIHNGQVKQIVGGSLKDMGDFAKENFVAKQDATFFAGLYKNAGIRGGHIILLNAKDSPYYDMTKQQAYQALEVYPGGLQVGGGITPENAQDFLKAGASHVIVTSYVFHDGMIDHERMKKLVDTVGKEHLVLDLSCKKQVDGYYIVTDRWQKLTRQKVTAELMDELKECCDEFLIHAVDVEGKSQGIEKELVSLIGNWGKHPVTYAGGVHNYEDLALLKQLGRDHLNVTIGSALDLFGGQMKWQEVMRFIAGEG